MAVTPYYNKATPGGLIRYYTEIAEAVKLPIIMYNVPGRTGCSILPVSYTHLFCVRIVEKKGYCVISWFEYLKEDDINYVLHTIIEA